MCIIADSVNDVSKTKIASFHVAYTMDGGKTIIPSQLVVYAANVDSVANTNAFILPVYNPGNDQKKIIPLDFSKLADFFYELANIYGRWFPEDTWRSANNSYNLEAQGKDFLPVYSVGDYKFSIMPSKIDFNRLDRLQLNINSAAKAAINVHPNDYSFIVYQFYKKGKIEITPFAYLCEPCREHAMIIPTIHGHPHADDPLGFSSHYFALNDFGSHKSEVEDKSDFDHEIYTLVLNPMAKNMDRKDLIEIDKLLSKITTDYVNRKVRIRIPTSFVPNKFTIKGYKQNRNILIKPDGFNFINDLTIDTQRAR